MSDIDIKNMLLQSDKLLEGVSSDIAGFADFAPDAKEPPGETAILTPTIPEEVYENLPEPLKGACSVFEIDRERDVFLTAAITVFSGCFNTVSGIYANKKVYPNLFSIVIANAASGKGTALFAKDMVQPLHNAMRAASQSAGTAMAVGGQTRKLLFVPANISYAAIIKQIHANDGKGIIFETEADTLSGTLKNDWAGYSDFLRRAFHHEPVSYCRVQNNEYIEIEAPQLSMFLSGTPGQVMNLIHSLENGLFSRLLVYRFHTPRVWKDVSPIDKPNLLEHFNGLSKKFIAIVNSVCDKPVDFQLTPGQWQRLNSEFENRLKMVPDDSEEAAASVLRLGLITFRIAMLLTIIRVAQGVEVSNVIVCLDADFESAMILTGVYLEHVLFLMDTLPKSAPLKPNIERFYAALPNEFSRKQAVEIGKQIGIGERMVGEHLKKMLELHWLESVKFGSYKKK